MGDAGDEGGHTIGVGGIGEADDVGRAGVAVVGVGAPDVTAVREAAGRDRQRGAGPDGWSQAEEDLGRTSSVAVATDQGAGLHPARAGG